MPRSLIRRSVAACLARAMNASPFSGAARCGLLLCFALLVAARLPQILLKGRFWAEEGAEFFVLGWSLPVWHALFAPWGGYLNITANLGGILAWHAVPLAAAPYATSLLALVIQLCPAILLLTSRVPWLNRPFISLAALLLVLTAPASDEIWLSSIGSQVHLTLCAALILVLEAQPGAIAFFRMSLLALAALSGPGAWLLAPLFAARTAFDRSVPRAWQTAMLAGCVLVQALFFYSHDPHRVYAIHPVLFADLAFAKHIVLPFLGPQRAATILDALYRRVAAGETPYWPAIALVLLAAAAAAIIRRHWRSDPFWLLLAAAVLIGVSYVGALNGCAAMFPVGSAGRYTYAPQVLISLALLGWAADSTGVARVTTTAVTVWLLIVGTMYYFHPTGPTFGDGPAWSSELALHRQNQSHLIRSWPPGWFVPLPDDRPR